MTAIRLTNVWGRKASIFLFRIKKNIATSIDSMTDYGIATGDDVQSSEP